MITALLKIGCVLLASKYQKKTGLVNAVVGVNVAGVPRQIEALFTSISDSRELGNIVNVTCFLSAAAVSQYSSALTPT